MTSVNRLNKVFDALKADLFEEINESTSIPFWAKSSVTGFLTDDKILRATKKAVAADDVALAEDAAKATPKPTT